MFDPIVKQQADNLVYIFPDSESLFQAIAMNFTERAIKAINQKNEFNVFYQGVVRLRSSLIASQRCLFAKNKHPGIKYSSLRMSATYH